MSNQDTKRIDQPTVNKPVNQSEMLHNTWTVMKPFVHFSIKAMHVLAHSLLFIVKSIPKPHEHNASAERKDIVIKG